MSHLKWHIPILVKGDYPNVISIYTNINTYIPNISQYSWWIYFNKVSRIRSVYISLYQFISVYISLYQFISVYISLYQFISVYIVILMVVIWIIYIYTHHISYIYIPILILYIHLYIYIYIPILVAHSIPNDILSSNQTCQRKIRYKWKFNGKSSVNAGFSS